MQDVKFEVEYQKVQNEQCHLSTETMDNHLLQFLSGVIEYFDN